MTSRLLSPHPLWTPEEGDEERKAWAVFLEIAEAACVPATWFRRLPFLDARRIANEWTLKREQLQSPGGAVRRMIFRPEEWSWGEFTFGPSEVASRKAEEAAKTEAKRRENAEVARRMAEDRHAQELANARAEIDHWKRAEAEVRQEQGLPPA